MKKTIEQNMQEARIKNNNEYYLPKLQKQEIDLKWLKNIKFQTIKYKNIVEIIAQEWKTNAEKLEEWDKIERIYNWLTDIKFDAWIWMYLDPETKNRCLEENVEIFCEATLEMMKATYLWKFRKYTEL